jgi:hypothetical protein
MRAFGRSIKLKNSMLCRRSVSYITARSSNSKPNACSTSMVLLAASAATLQVPSVGVVLGLAGGFAASALTTLQGRFEVATKKASQSGGRGLQFVVSQGPRIITATGRYDFLGVRGTCKVGSSASFLLALQTTAALVQPFKGRRTRSLDRTCPHCNCVRYVVLRYLPTHEATGTMPLM